mmetsp:Transcript_48138/g.95018  ORF Transcript_48138/g.95018 Transcript_48138/m.95018 type:complete len:160 (-) Transcript_48138:903-1382(-)
MRGGPGKFPATDPHSFTPSSHQVSQSLFHFFLPASLSMANAVLFLASPPALPSSFGQAGGVVDFHLFKSEHPSTRPFIHSLTDPSIHSSTYPFIHSVFPHPHMQHRRLSSTQQRNRTTTLPLSNENSKGNADDTHRPLPPFLPAIQTDRSIPCSGLRTG